MDEHRDDFPRPSDFPRLADAYSGDGFPEHGPWAPLSAAVLADALEALKESRGLITAEGGLCPETHIPEVERSCGANADSAAAYRERLKAQTRAAKEIAAAHADPHWLDGHWLDGH